MNKKIIWCLAGVLMASAVLAADETASKPALQRAYLDLIPDSTMLMISVPDVAELKNVIEDPQFKKLLDSLAFNEKFLKQLTEADAKFFEQTGMHLKDLYDAVSTDLAFAMLDSDFKEQHEFVLLLGIPDDGTFYNKIISSVLEHPAEDFTPKTHNIDGVEVVQTKEDAFFTYYNDHIVIATSLDSATKVIKPVGSLANDPTFKKHFEITDLSKGIVFYVNAAQILERVTAEQTELTPEESKQRELAINILGLKNLKAVSLAFSLKEGEPLRFFYECPNCEGFFSAIFSREPVGTSIATIIPSDFHAFGAISIKDATDIFDSMMTWTQDTQPGADQSLKQMEEELEQKAGLDLKEDLLKPFGNRLAFGVKLTPDAKVTSIMDLSSIPRMFFNMVEFEIVFALKDPERLLNSIRTLVSHYSDKMKELYHEGIPIFRIKTPQVQSEIFLSIYTSHMIISFNMGTIMHVIDEVQAGRSLNSVQDFQAAMGIVPADACMVGYSSKEYFPKELDFLFSLIEPEMDKEKLVDLRAAIDNYVGEGSTGTSYGVIKQGGLYSEAHASPKKLIAMVPLLVSMFSETVEEQIKGEEEETEEQK